MGTYTFWFGYQTFFLMLLVAGLLVGAGSIGGRAPSARLPGWLAVAGALLLAALLARDGTLFSRAVRDVDLEAHAADIAANTYVAGSRYLDGANPYRERAQLLHELTPGPHVTVQGDSVKLFGVSYSYGYPYFPAMFLSYLPFRGIGAGYHAIRWGNALCFALTLVLTAWLAARSAPPLVRWPAALLATMALAGADVLPDEIFGQGVTDILIGCYALAGYLLWSYGRPLGAGVLLGIAQSCKLLPGPLLVAPLLLSSDRQRRGQLLGGYLLTTVVLVGPFAWADPARFVSSTVLYYLAYHSNGDTTSLWYYLPQAARPVFTFAGDVIVIAVVLSAMKGRTNDVVRPLAVAFLAYFLFTAVAPMTHLNYVWAVYPLGCVAFAAQLARGTSGRHRWAE